MVMGISSTLTIFPYTNQFCPKRHWNHSANYSSNKSLKKKKNIAGQFLKFNVVLIFRLISQLGANRLGSPSSRGIHFQIYQCVDRRTLTLISSLPKISLLHGFFKVASKISSLCFRTFVSSFEEDASAEMVFSYEVKTLTLDLFPSELIALKMPGFNPRVLQLHSFPSVEENHTTFPQPIHQTSQLNTQLQNASA